MFNFALWFCIQRPLKSPQNFPKSPQIKREDLKIMHLGHTFFTGPHQMIFLHCPPSLPKSRETPYTSNGLTVAVFRLKSEKKHISGYLLIYGVTGSVLIGTGWYLVALGQYWAILVYIWWYWVSRRRYMLVLGGTGSVRVGTCWYLVVMGQYRLVLVDIWWYVVSRGQYWSVLG